MRTRTTLAAATAALLLTLTGCGDSQAETEAKCVKAVKARAEGDKSKPKACDSLSEDIYNTLVIGAVLEEEGLGNLDENPEDLLDYAEDGVVDNP